MRQSSRPEQATQHPWPPADHLAEHNVEEKDVAVKHPQGERSAIATRGSVEGEGESLSPQPSGQRRSGLHAILSTLLSRTTIASTPGPPPDGGKLAWTQGEPFDHYVFSIIEH